MPRFPDADNISIAERFIIPFCVPKRINTQKFETELNRTSTDSLVNIDVLSARVKAVVNGQMAIAQSLQDLQQRISLIATKKELDSFKKKLDDVAPEHLARSFRVNATGPLLVAKHVHPLLRHERKAVLATLSARVGSIGDNRLGGWYGYRASKAAQNMVVRTVAVELARKAKNAIVMALHPGTVDTGLSAPFQRNVPPGKLFEVERAARQLLAIVDRADASYHGTFRAWDDTEIPW